MRKGSHGRFHAHLGGFFFKHRLQLLFGYDGCSELRAIRPCRAHVNACAAWLEAHATTAQQSAVAQWDLRLVAGFFDGWVVHSSARCLIPITC